VLFGLATVVAASIANVLVYYVGDLFIRYDPAFVELGSAFGIAIFTLVLSIGAVPVYAMLLHSVKHPERVFTIVSAVLLALSVIPDITYIPSVPGASNAQTSVLILMHIVAAAVIVGMLTRHTRQRAS
jgi:hypothetical protein